MDEVAKKLGYPPSFAGRSLAHVDDLTRRRNEFVKRTNRDGIGAAIIVTNVKPAYRIAKEITGALVNVWQPPGFEWRANGG